MKKALILKGSCRAHGNTSRLADEFARGARQAGHDVAEASLRTEDIGDCRGCGACQRNGGACALHDDMAGILGQMMEADAVVLASPVYFYTWTSLMKRALDRTFAIEGTLRDTTFYLICAGAAPEERYQQTMVGCFDRYVSCFRAGGVTAGGAVIGVGANGPGDIEGSDAVQKAFEMGLGA